LALEVKMTAYPDNGLLFRGEEEAVSHGPTGRRVLVGDKAFRWRRGKMVEIPAEWVGQTVHRQTLRKRRKNR
jgi:hypothetical protein